MTPAEATRITDAALQGGVLSVMFVIVCLWAMMKAWPQWLAEQKERRAGEAAERQADRAERSAELQRLIDTHRTNLDLIIAAFDRNTAAMNSATATMSRAVAEFADESRRCPMRESQQDTHGRPTVIPGGG